MIRARRAREEPPILRETEIFPDGRPRAIGTVYLENGACPLACVYCALYRGAGDGPAAGEEIARQIRSARRRLGAVDGIKLYNASSLFEPRSIRQTESDLAAIAAETADVGLVVVESRSEQAGRAPAFARRLRGRLEVAIGLEAADDALLRRLGKPTTVERFRGAARTLADAGILLRAFVLVQPPYVAGEQARELAKATFRLARDCGARVVSLLPVVSDHAPMERLRAEGRFTEIALDDYFSVVADCVAEGGAVVLAELPSLPRLPGCPTCRDARAAALGALNATGRLPAVACADHRPAAPPGP
jgi:radical SAM enzyme (TIGR01210 family)